MADEIKRLHYYDQQFLREPDFTDEQTYHLEMRRRHNRLLHGWGIADGLTVIKKSAHVITVQPGMAVDATGREIILSEPHDITFLGGAGERNKRYYVTIRYQEELTDPPPPQDIINPSDRTRVTESPDFPSPSSSVSTPGETLILGRVRLANSGNAPIHSINLDKRQYIPGIVPSGAIIIWTGAACPPGYDRVAELDNMFLRGGTNYNPNAGGSDTHTHTVPSHNHSIPNHNHSIPNHNHSIPNHNHSIPNHNHWVSGVDTGTNETSAFECNNSRIVSVHGNKGEDCDKVHSWHHHYAPGRYTNNKTGLKTNNKTGLKTNNKTGLKTNLSGNIDTTSQSSVPRHATVVFCRKR